MFILVTPIGDHLRIDKMGWKWDGHIQLSTPSDLGINHVCFVNIQNLVSFIHWKPSFYGLCTYYGVSRFYSRIFQ